MIRLAALLLVLGSPLAAAAQQEPDEVQPGLAAAYESLADPKASLARLEAKPAFHLGRSSPHPRIPTGPFEVKWTGTIALKEPGRFAFSAFVGGEVALTIDGVKVPDGRGPTDASRVVATEPLKREQGIYPLEIRFRSLADVPARLQIW